MNPGFWKWYTWVALTSFFWGASGALLLDRGPAAMAGIVLTCAVMWFFLFLFHQMLRAIQRAFTQPTPIVRDDR